MSTPMLIGIAGGTGSGKSTFAQGLKRLFPDEITIISYDNYYKPQDHLSMEERVKTNYDCPDALDTDLLVKHLRELLAGNFSGIFPHIWWVLGYATVSLATAVLLFLRQMKNQ